MIEGRVAEKSNPSNLDCIQIETSSSKLVQKFTFFCRKIGIVQFYAFLYDIKNISQKSLQTLQKFWMQFTSVKALDASLLLVNKRFPEQ